MRLERISLHRFRNYKDLFLEFPGSLNVFIGENAQGKTNLLEAIYLLAVGHSYRTSRDADLIGWGEPAARIQADVERELGRTRVEITLRRDGPKEIRLQGEAIRRQSDLFGRVNVVVFSPDDLQLVKGSPSLRRRFLDLEIAQVSAAYRHHFSRYVRILKQRNNLLKAVQGGQAFRDALEAWNPQLISYGARVISERARTVERLSHWSRETHAAISGGREELTLEYRPFFASDDAPYDPSWKDTECVEQEFRRALGTVQKDEIARGTTLIGPQRDDIAFKVGEIDLRYFGSQGQQRTAVLSCKLAELEFMREEVGEYPILLLDDVMSELDDSRRERFMRTVTGRVDTFITTTHLRGFSRDVLDAATQYEIRAGEVSPRQPA